MNSVQFFIHPMVPGPQAEESTFLRDRRPKASLQVEASAHAYARSGAQCWWETAVVPTCTKRRTLLVLLVTEINAWDILDTLHL